MNPQEFNPRVLYRDKGREAVGAYLQLKGGYVPQKKALTYFCNQLWFQNPLLLEGERGAGKTALPEAVAEAFNLPLFQLNCNTSTSSEDVLGSWNRELQKFYSSELRADGKRLDQISQEIFVKDFFDCGVALEAFDYSVTNKRPCVLMLDEVDKLDERVEDLFLQLLARGFHSVARLKPNSIIGFTKDHNDDFRFEAFPIVIATSNNMRGGLSSPFRSRFSCCFIKSPSQEEMVEIILARVPQLADENFQIVFLQLVRLIDSVRGLSLQEKPALREFINFAIRLTASRERVSDINKQFLDDNLDALAKTEKDAEVFNDRLEGLILDAHQEGRHLTSGVRRGDSFYTAEELVAYLLDRRYQVETNLHQFSASFQS